MYKKEVNNVDFTTGEILTTETTIIKKVNADEFIQVYLDDISGLLRISSKTEMAVLTWLWKYSVYAEEGQPGNMVSLSPVLFESIKNSSDLSDGTIRNAMSDLKKKNLIISHDKFRGTYYLNPKYFFKGKLSDRTESYKLSLEYQLNNNN